MLDEPSIGLHPRDNQRLIDALGESAVARQHGGGGRARRDDHAPGRLAGRPWARGRPARRPDRRPRHAASKSPPIPHSLTGRYLAGVEQIPVPERRRRIAKTRAITIEGVTTNNLKNVTVQFPLSALVCVTGVSGSGKSSLLNETLARALVRRLGGIAAKPGPHTSLRGVKPDRQGGADRPVAHRPHAAEQSGHVHRRVRRDPQGVRQHPRRPAARLQGRPLQLQRQGRAVRGVPGPRAAADRDELPARSLRRLPGVRRQTVQPPDAGNPLPRPLDRRRARHAGRRGGRVLRELPRHRPAGAAACRRWAWAT